MAERPPKRCSYPSSQRRVGPAPLASFEDLSDEIESPTEKNSHPLPEIEEELKLHADAATPSTPRVPDAASPPSPLTPGADLSSTSTPRVDSFPPSWDEGATTGGSAEFSHEGSRQSLAEAPNAPQLVTFQVPPPPPPRPRAANIKNSKSSSFMDDVRGAEAAEALASSLPERAATPECLPHATAPPSKKSSLTSGQSSRTPSRTPSPNSPRRFFSFFKHRDDSEPGSPASPKSPRKTSFTNLFKLGGRKSPDERAVSPTARKGSLSIFFKKDKDAKLRRTTPEDPPLDLSSKGQKEATNRNVFSSLFKKDKKLAQVRLTLQATSVDVPVEIASTGWTSREISLHSHLCDLLDGDDDDDEGPAEDAAPVPAPITNGKREEAVEVYVDAKGPEVNSRNDEEEEEERAVAAAFAAQERRSKRPLDRGDAVVAEEHPARLSELRAAAAKSTSDERISSGSEQETDYDPVSLKKRPTSEDYEVETLITEESAEYDEYPPPLPLPSDRRAAPPIRRQRLVDLTTTPIDRPRSSTPLSVTSIEAFIRTASPPPDRARADADKKLKVSLPGDEFAGRGRSPRKMAVKKWTDFCQEALHSPRARRRDDEDEDESATATAAAAAASWVTFENAPELVPETTVGVRGPRVSEADLERSDLMFDARRFSPEVANAEDCKCECHKVRANGVKTPPADASSQTSCGATWARDRATQMPSQDSTTCDSSGGESVNARRSRSTQMPSQDSMSLETPRRSATVESTSSGEICRGDSLEGRDPLLLVSNGSEDSECEHDTTGEFTDAHTCSEHSTSPSTTTFDRCHVFFPRNGEDRNGI